MGNNSKQPVEKKRKKKGRPSLLDLQKRSLRLQKQQEQQHRNPSPSPNPYLRFPPASIRAARRNDGGDESDSSDGGARREKKLKFVLHLPRHLGDSAPSASDSDPDPDPDRSSDKGDGNFAKATDENQGETSDSGPTTPLPDQMLLVFILDRLQKKDTYGVFSEPVDPNELPDYHEIIEHPMDFATVRKKLSSGAYENLEQFEKDVFLISSNAMRYNSPDTIYYRQARSIQELAKKNFENLRQESDDNEPEPKPLPRRGRPPSKKMIKTPVGRSPAEHASLDSSDILHINVGDNELLRRGSASDKPGVSTRSCRGLQNTQTFSLMGEHREDRKEEYSGYALKGFPLRYGKKSLVIDENRRDTYKQPQLPAYVREPSLLSTFDGERKQLIPVGLHMEHTYARSLVRFAANLGPVVWDIAAEKIEKTLPPGTKFNHGWVGNSEAPQQTQPMLLSTSPPHHSLHRSSPCSALSRGDQICQKLDQPPAELAVEGHVSRSLPPAISAVSSKSSDSTDGAEPATTSSHEAGCGGDSGNSQSMVSLQLQEMAMQPTANGFSTPFGFGLSSQLANMVRPVVRSGSGSLVTPMTHGRALDMVFRGNSISQRPTSQLDIDRAKFVGNSSTVSFVGSTTDPSNDSQSKWRGLMLHQTLESAPPDLNVQFQSPGSPTSGALVDQKQPDLALQL